MLPQDQGPLPLQHGETLRGTPGWVLGVEADVHEEPARGVLHGQGIWEQSAGMG
ncbi:hypothetical protein E4U53_003437, partial [Claviceps sorghi]